MTADVIYATVGPKSQSDKSRNFALRTVEFSSAHVLAQNYSEALACGLDHWIIDDGGAHLGG
ncbi:hypothetical protein [Arthrobacter sp. NPDC089319]|uniref:hypothetical protein n=1 Tax=Arthrobacter sp. NPDC089319 TaxID=3155915 RepID=UPI00343370D3